MSQVRIVTASLGDGLFVLDNYLTTLRIWPLTANFKADFRKTSALTAAALGIEAEVRKGAVAAWFCFQVGHVANT